MQVNVVLIGMPGAGKSTLGVLLAKALGMEFIDTDILIQKNEGRRLQEIIDHYGIEYFLNTEERTILGLNAFNSVIATGGSVIYSEKAMVQLREKGKVLYLHLPYHEIEKRLKNIKTRGIVMKKGSLREEYEERIPLYSKYSDLTINCENKDIEQCINDIVLLLAGKHTFGSTL